MHMDTSGILEVVKDSKLINPSEEKVRSTPLGSREAFQNLLEQSRKDPATFWESVARELIWYEPWNETMRGELPDFRFFVGGVSNPSVNLLDDMSKMGLVIEQRSFGKVKMVISHF